MTGYVIEVILQINYLIHHSQATCNLYTAKLILFVAAVFNIPLWAGSGVSLAGWLFVWEVVT